MSSRGGLKRNRIYNDQPNNRILLKKDESVVENFERLSSLHNLIDALPNKLYERETSLVSYVKKRKYSKIPNKKLKSVCDVVKVLHVGESMRDVRILEESATKLVSNRLLVGLKSDCKVSTSAVRLHAIESLNNYSNSTKFPRLPLPKKEGEVSTLVNIWVRTLLSAADNARDLCKSLFKHQFVLAKQQQKLSKKKRKSTSSSSSDDDDDDDLLKLESECSDDDGDAEDEREKAETQFKADREVGNCVPFIFTGPLESTREAAKEYFAKLLESYPDTTWVLPDSRLLEIGCVDVLTCTAALLEGFEIASTQAREELTNSLACVQIGFSFIVESAYILAHKSAQNGTTENDLVEVLKTSLNSRLTMQEIIHHFRSYTLQYTKLFEYAKYQKTKHDKLNKEVFSVMELLYSNFQTLMRSFVLGIGSHYYITDSNDDDGQRFDNLIQSVFRPYVAPSYSLKFGLMSQSVQPRGQLDLLQRTYELQRLLKTKFGNKKTLPKSLWSSQEWFQLGDVIQTKTFSRNFFPLEDQESILSLLESCAMLSKLYKVPSSIISTTKTDREEAEKENITAKTPAQNKKKALSTTTVNSIIDDKTTPSPTKYAATSGKLKMNPNGKLSGRKNMRFVLKPLDNDSLKPIEFGFEKPVTVGRGTNCVLQFKGTRNGKNSDLMCISRNHATIVASEGLPKCQLHVLSSNGVNVNKESVLKNQTCTLKPGDIVNFCRRKRSKTFRYKLECELSS